MSLFGNINNNNSNDENVKPDKVYKNVIDIFERYYIKASEVFKMHGVPSSRFPSREHFISKVFACLDEKRLSEWIEKYAEIEAIVIEQEKEEE